MRIAPDLDVEVERFGTWSVLRLAGDLRLWNRESAEAALLDTFKREVPAEPRRLVLNLASIRHIDTRGIRALVQVLIECGRGGIGLFVVMPVGVPGQVLRAVRIFDGWPMVDSERAATERP